MNRRRFITVIAAGGVIALLPGCDDIPASALAPWAGPQPDLTDVRLKALSWAMLAPNPHNLQSWLVDVRRPGEVRFHVDCSRLLPETDPCHRQILVGCGAFLELFTQALGGYGQACDIQTFPEGIYAGETVDSRPFAVARLVSGRVLQPDSSIFHTIALRRSAKVAYGSRRPGAEELAVLEATVPAPGLQFGCTAEPIRTARLTKLACRGYETEFDTPTAAAESLRVCRVGAEAIAADPSGVAVHGPALWWGRKLGLVDPSDLLDPQNSHVRSAFKAVVEQVSRTFAWGWIVTEDNSRPAQLAAGRAYLCMNLAATERGLAVHPCSQNLQEFPAMRELYAALHRELGVTEPARVQMFFRIGYSETPVPPTPRRIVDRILMRSEQA